MPYIDKPISVHMLLSTTELLGFWIKVLYLQRSFKYTYKLQLPQKRNVSGLWKQIERPDCGIFYTLFLQYVDIFRSVSPCEWAPISPSDSITMLPLSLFLVIHAVRKMSDHTAFLKVTMHPCKQAFYLCLLHKKRTDSKNSFQEKQGWINIISERW